MHQVVPETSKKAVFIISSAIQGTNYDILEHLIRGSNLEYCVVITSAHASLQNMLQWSGTRDTHQEMEAFQNLEEDILDWMGNMVLIFHIDHILISMLNFQDVVLIELHSRGV